MQNKSRTDFYSVLLLPDYYELKDYISTSIITLITMRTTMSPIKITANGLNPLALGFSSVYCDMAIKFEMNK